MNISFVDLYAQYLSIQSEIDAAIAAVIRESAFIRGLYVETFEAEFAAAHNVKHCVSCANGTDALYITIKGLGVKAGDEIITTAHSWISTSETITQAGGKVVFCETDAETFTIDPVCIAKAITPRTVGIVPVHLYGQPADMDAIMKLAQEHNLWVLEDCAQAVLARYKGQLVGTFGVAATFSFYPGKNLGAMGDAGAIITSDTRLANWCALYARHGGKGEHQIEGINSRMDGMQAAILSVKLKHLPGWTKQRQTIAALYDRDLALVDRLRVPRVATDREHVYHLYVIRAEERDALRQHLGGCGIPTVLNYPRALPLYPAYKHLGYTPLDLPNAYGNQSTILSLPVFPELPEEQREYICASIHKFYESKN